MMKFYIYLFQKKAQPMYKKAMDEYMKRLQAYANVSIKYIKNEKQMKKYEKEAQNVFYIVPGKESLTSPAFADRIQKMSVQGISVITFFIGDFIDNEKPEGTLFHLSSFSMNYSLTAVVLLEQIYRAYRIINHQPYHK